MYYDVNIYSCGKIKEEEEEYLLCEKSCDQQFLGKSSA
jgi:hypothetical protein